jgi:cadmium resistance protein CadD (predicted permease)
MIVSGLSAPDSIFGTVTCIVLAFAASSIDDFALLACMYADRSARVREITGAKLFCASLALCIAIAFGTGCRALPLSTSRLAGLVPFLLGVKRLIGNRKKRTDAGVEASSAYAPMCTGGMMRRVFRYVAILFAASFDNIALYVPLFLHDGQAVIAPTISIILSLTGILCGLALLSSRIRIRLRGTRLRLEPAVPFLMMLIGIKAFATF